MTETGVGIYESIASRTNGDIYIGVIGPVRTGKSTFVKRFMENMVIPYIENIYQKERAKDELPQSGSGKTIMTSEPKFVPEEAVTISPNGKISANIRLIDSVGYMIPGAVGADEEGAPRMVTTPWFPDEIPMTQAAEVGTRKIMEDHCTIGMIVTTDGSITDIPRSEYIQAERKAIMDMQATGKPFLVLINSQDPEGREAAALKKELEQAYGITCLCVNCMTMDEDAFQTVLTKVICEFPVTEIRVEIPRWIGALDQYNSMKKEIFKKILEKSVLVHKLSQAESILTQIADLEIIEKSSVSEIDVSSGIVNCEIRIPECLFYRILSEQTGFPVENEADLIGLLSDLASVKRSYDKVASALDEVRATGYGIVMPTPDEMELEIPQIVRKGSNYGVRLKASAPSIHMLRADIETEISPIVGDEKQSKDLLQYLLKEYEDDTEKLWESNIFGKSVYELVNEGLGSKLRRMPEQSRFKLQSTLSRIINEGSTGLLCIILS